MFRTFLMSLVVVVLSALSLSLGAQEQKKCKPYYRVIVEIPRGTLYVGVQDGTHLALTAVRNLGDGVEAVAQATLPLHHNLTFTQKDDLTEFYVDDRRYTLGKDALANILPFLKVTPENLALHREGDTITFRFKITWTYSMSTKKSGEREGLVKISRRPSVSDPEGTDWVLGSVTLPSAGIVFTIDEEATLRQVALCVKMLEIVESPNPVADQKP